MNTVEALKSSLDREVNYLADIEEKYKKRKKGEVYNSLVVLHRDRAIYLAQQLKNFGNGNIRQVLIYSKHVLNNDIQKIYHTIWLDSRITEEEIKSYYALYNYEVLEVNFREDLLLGFPRIERK